MSQYYLTKEDYLSHHGILGQKWGKLNGPPYPLGEGKHSARERKEGYTKSKIGKRNDHLYDRNDQKRYEQKKKQLTAQQKAYIGAAVGAAVALGVGAVAYVAIKKGVNPIENDFTLDAGSVIQRVTPDNQASLHDTFYAAVNEHDKQRYENTMPNHYMNPNGLFGPMMGKGPSEVYLKEIKVNSDVKIAGHKNCEKILNELMRDSDFKKRFKEIGINGYDEFNQYAAGAREKELKPLYDKFFDKLKENGYQGFLDINDQKYSGYNAKAPVVLFNDEKIFDVNKVTLLETSAKRAYEKAEQEFGGRVALEETVKLIINDPVFMSQMGMYTVVGGAVLGAKASESINESKSKQNDKKRT